MSKVFIDSPYPDEATMAVIRKVPVPKLKKITQSLRSTQPTLKELQMSDILPQNRVLDADSYKLSHAGVYPKNVIGLSSYLSARLKGSTIVPIGLQMYVIKSLLTPIQKSEVDEAVTFAAAHGEPFDREPWDYLLDRYNGYMPITIRAIPEGMKVPGGFPIVTVECVDEKLYWLASYVETSLQRAVWYPSTIASNDFKAWKHARYALDRTADNFDSLPFMLHDFGGRGVTSEESAQVGGMAHLVYFMGSDTISGVRAANFYYGCKSGMAAHSVPATEHSIQCSYGSSADDQLEYLNAILDKYAKPGAIVSIVLDGYDVYREAEALCSGELKDKVIASGARIVFRPDSGDPLEVIPRLLKLMAATYGFTINSKGYKQINHVGIIQGDGIDNESMQAILDKVTSLQFAASNIVFGSGGGLLQKVNRDTYKFAMKVSAKLIRKDDGSTEWVDIFKDPITDPGKKSLTGRVTVLKGMNTKELIVGRYGADRASEWEDQLQLVYAIEDGKGKLFNRTTLDEVRERAMS